MRVAQAMGAPGAEPSDPAMEIEPADERSLRGESALREEPAPRDVRPPMPMRRKLLWCTVAALALGDMVLVVVLFPQRSSVPLPPVARVHRGSSTHLAKAESKPPVVADAPSPTTPASEPPHPIPTTAPRVTEVPPASEGPKPVSDPPKTSSVETPPAPIASAEPVVEPPAPAPPKSTRERLQIVQAALDGGRRAFARVELGRILLDLDALPPAEREPTRAQAELLVARALQVAADETRRAAR
jgi:hypothetical protein